MTNLLKKVLLMLAISVIIFSLASCDLLPAELVEKIPGLGGKDEHVHAFGDATCTTPATCECGETEGEALGHGYVDGKCTACGAEDPNYVPPHTHSYEAVVTAPTCTEAGYTTYTCACGDTYTADETAALGHIFADGKCTTCGAEDPNYVPHTHSYLSIVTNPTCTEAGYTTFNCYCGYSYTGNETAALGHSYTFACDAHCAVCGELTNENAAHSVTYVEAKAATCFENGNVAYYLCEICGNCWLDEALIQVADRKVIPAAHQNLQHFDAIEPGCHFTGNVEYWHCYTCGGVWTNEALTEVSNVKNVIRPATGDPAAIHVEASDPTCTELGNVEYWYCDTCEKVWLDEALTQLSNRQSVKIGTVDHAYEENSWYHPSLNSATCVAPGVGVMECIYGCGDYYTFDTEIDPFAHEWDYVNAEIITAPDCSTMTDGVIKVTCTLCGASEEQTEYAFHTYENEEYIFATCTTDGSYYACCSVCGYEDSYVIEAGGHNNYLLACGETGICMDCEIEFTKEHDLTDPSCTDPAFCFGCWQSFGEALGHSYVNGFCEVCGEADYDHEHNFAPATCTTPATCECGATEGEALGHSYMFACDATCMVCGEFTNEDAAHSITLVSGTPATCTTDGVADVYKCEICGYGWLDEELTIIANRMSIVIYAGHTYMYACDAHCAVCGELTNENAAHSITLVSGTPATCTTDGVADVYKCEICGYGWLDEELTIIANRMSIVIYATGHDFDEANCTSPKTCAICDATEGEALGHIDENGDFKCDRCSTTMLPADGTALTIPQALAIAAIGGTKYTTQKYYITGIVTNLYNTQYGNFYIKDADGNEICIYGLYSADGNTRYDAMSYKPVEGDEVTVYTVLGMYSTTKQGKNAWLDEVVAHTHDYSESVTAPTCTNDGYTTYTCSICKGSYTGNETDALGHTTDNGECERCGLTIGGTEPVIGTLVKFDFGANGSAAHVDGNDYGTSKTFTEGGYTLSLTGMSKVYGPAYDAKGNSCIKLGTSSKTGTFSFTVGEDVTEVVIYVAKYKANTTKISVNGTAYTISGASNNGAYDAITIDTSVNKTITFSTVSGGVRCMINAIEFKGQVA